MLQKVSKIKQPSPMVRREIYALQVLASAERSFCIVKAG